VGRTSILEFINGNMESESIIGGKLDGGIPYGTTTGSQYQLVRTKNAICFTFKNAKWEEAP